MPTAYDDDYPTCSRTYAGLRIYQNDLDPDRITRLLGVEPTDTQVRGRVSTEPRGSKFVPRIGGWFLSTKGVITSRDVLRHVDLILDWLAGKDETLRNLQ